MNQYAAPIQEATAAADSEARPVRARATMTAISPAVATTSPTHSPTPDRAWSEICTAGRSNITLASSAPPMPPMTWATV